MLLAEPLNVKIHFLFSLIANFHLLFAITFSLYAQFLIIELRGARFYDVVYGTNKNGTSSYTFFGSSMMK